MMAAARALPPALLGALAMLGCLVAVQANFTLIKHLGESFPPAQLAFARGAVQGLVVLAFFKPGKLWIGRWARDRFILARGSLMGVGSFVATVAIVGLPLQDSTALTFAGPLFAVPLAAWWLRERQGWSVRLAVAVGFLGVLAIAPPGRMLEPAVAGAILTAFIGALDSVLLRIAAPGERTGTFLLATSLGMMATLGLPTFLYGVWPDTLLAGFLLILSGLLSIVAEGLFINACRLAPVALVMPLDYLRLALALAVDALLFDLAPKTATLVGAALIIGAALVILRAAARQSAPAG